MGVDIYRSRYTPGINAYQTRFKKGETVIWKSINGYTVKIIIDSERMVHDGTGKEIYGYECIFKDDNSRCFVDEHQIIDWNGKE